MATLKAVVEQHKKDGDLAKCDSCKKTFLHAKVQLVDPIENISILTPLYPFIFVNKNGIITGGFKMASKKKGDKVFKCPLCGFIHLYGFDEVTK